MSFSDLHVHTVFSDGKNTPEEMVLAAIEKGMKCIGFSDHAYTPFDEDFCIAKHEQALYRSTVSALKEKYKDKITVLCGIEQDLCSDVQAECYDYVIGSLHYVYADNMYIPVDHSPEVLLQSVQEHFQGDIYSFIEAYYRMLAEMAENAKIDLIGHFDLVCKFNEGGRLFDETDPRYVCAWQAAVDRLLKKKIPFEINTGAISRGYRSAPYPAEPICDYIRANGGSFMLSSDCHKAENLCYGFEKWSLLL